MAISKLLLLAVPLGIGLVASSSAKRSKAPSPPSPPTPGGGTPPPPPPGPGVPAGQPPPTPPSPSTPVVPGAVIASLPENYVPGRERMLFDAVAAGLYDPPEIYAVNSPGEGPMAGYTLRVPVMADALKIEGIRINTAFNTAQAIFDAIGGWMMLTPYVCGLIYEQAHAQLSPTTSAELSIKEVTARKSQMIEASQRVDQKLAPIKSARDDQGLVTLVGNPGKDKVLTIQYTYPGVHPKSGVPKSEAGANHGLYTAPWNPIQNVGLFHPRSHVDYSETVRGMGTHSILLAPDGSATRVANADILRDPVRAHMLTGVRGKIYGKQGGEGPLPFDRHPKLVGGVRV